MTVEKSHLNRAAFVHALTELEAESAREWGVDGEIVIAPNGIDLARIPRYVDPEPVLIRHPVLRGRRRFIYVGRLDPEQKGLDILLDAFSLAGRSDCALALVGPDWRGGREKLEASVRRLELSDRVVFCGPAFGQEKYEYLASADVFVHPSRWEGLPFSVLEAGAMGKACLVSHSADPGGIVGRTAGGLRVPPEAHAIAAAVRHLSGLEHSDLVAMGERLRRGLAHEFNWDTTARTIHEAYVRAGAGSS